MINQANVTVLKMLKGETIIWTIITLKMEFINETRGPQTP